MARAIFALGPLLEFASLDANRVKVGDVFVLLAYVLLGEENIRAIRAQLGVTHELELQKVFGLDCTPAHVARLPTDGPGNYPIEALTYRG